MVVTHIWEGVIYFLSNENLYEHDIVYQIYIGDRVSNNMYENMEFYWSEYTWSHLTDLPPMGFIDYPLRILNLPRNKDDHHSRSAYTDKGWKPKVGLFKILKQKSTDDSN